MKGQIVHWVVAGSAALLFSAAARALPEPAPMGSKLYLWFYNFAHSLLANFDKVGKP